MVRCPIDVKKNTGLIDRDNKVVFDTSRHGLDQGSGRRHCLCLNCICGIIFYLNTLGAEGVWITDNWYKSRIHVLAISCMAKYL